ncbi:unnamed protein product [Arabidopsis lyrata]|uniref:Predicted protein n=1 Tax=Arabidopsis lyrata subsp. lyrata TaxID=81972 RepID=D7MX18_ARALL|nr:predicted protein [Arabidopsis lyrata subsp. lyrata]CAH8253156.1 unnamed protein product [Arabidopsis lyrata]
MDAHHRQAAAHENRFRLMNPALFIVLLTVVPFLSSPVGLNPTNPPPGMTPATFQAIKITSQCFYPLSYLAAIIVLVQVQFTVLVWLSFGIPFLMFAISSSSLISGYYLTF